MNCVVPDAHAGKRAADPLAQVPDAVVLDSTELGIDEVVARVVAMLADDALPTAEERA